MEKLFFSSVTETVLDHVAHDIIQAFNGTKIILFYGDLGSGKTTLIKEICSQLAVRDGMSSPSFSIINEYRTKQNEPIYHLDLYRLKSREECLDLGIEEYLFSGHYCFIEWPELALSLLPDAHLCISITREKDNTRSIILS